MNSRELIERYVQGWKRGDEDVIISTLSPECIITESHGPTYHGIEEVREWIREWNEAKNSVDTWDLILFKIADQYVFFEWDFSCTVGDKQHSFLGASIAEIHNGKILELREYRMTNKPIDQ